MGLYCDNSKLEDIWFNWELSSITPELDEFRKLGCLCSLKIDDTIILYKLCTYNPVTIKYMNNEFINYSEKDLLICLSSPVDEDLIEKYVSHPDNEWNIELPSSLMWDDLASMVYTLCCKIVLNFKPKSEDEKSDLVHEAYHQIISKLVRGKLKFHRGKAPAFNLLTTAIIRVMCTIKTKESRQIQNKSKLIDRIMHQNDKSMRDFRVCQSTIQFKNTPTDN